MAGGEGVPEDLKLIKIIPFPWDTYQSGMCTEPRPQLIT